MPIIAAIGRRHWRVRLIVGVLYTALTVGAVTMVYPFCIMLSGTSKSAVDFSESKAVPAFLKDKDATYRKYTEALLNESMDTARMAYGVKSAQFQDLTQPAAVSPALVAEWKAFLDETELPAYYFHVGQTTVKQSRGAVPEMLRAFKMEMTQRFDDDIDRLNKELERNFPSWQTFGVTEPDLMARREHPAVRAFDKVFDEFKKRQPVDIRVYLSVEGYFNGVYLPALYGRKIENYNKANGTSYPEWSDVHLSRTIPGAGYAESERTEWVRFVGQIIGLLWIRADRAATEDWRSFLLAKYETMDILNERYETDHASFAVVPFPEAAPARGVARVDWAEFIQGWKDVKSGKTLRMAPEHLRVHSTEFLFRDWLKAKYATLSQLNKALSERETAVDTAYAISTPAFSSWMEVLPPQQDLHALDFEKKIGHIRWEFVTRNYRAVFGYVFLHGRALRNTVVYVTLSVLASLLVNPLAAYGLSRYKPRNTYKILLFLMLTMAFPAMVTQIPVFLMLRQFHLLNTYWALILPGLANGYSIFMLKGFFDSLPQELYESAELDGAGEFRIFWTITISLSTPILAVMTLGAFTSAYSNFMMALLICQDERMWTIMPWLYQLQQSSSEGIIFASLVIAAAPTLIVFCFCQNIIMRGIVVPVEK